ncbi:MAG: tRNA (N6-isopentenyl adenosine(37)-C2)-methylthiotransferase MiaB [Verrucomicrobia bacterium CG_4_10_14_3_um_filter_43_23]|nr:MAG: tRNA (N6-isopentenyl adenosine(37)-C2)-methylthiotransferase MiaB [Verrucomicrobia bacterium CG1_02_43_26]PIX58471.1 MAG: tRNA (N6-isopentenyl adenosine(37)-C2)-methylthiotransferase MiaB [Verrucomicrobia bacterium CG_4_10_14_3_um_filter_43_23]
MNRVYIKTYGCQMNERDSEAVAAMLRGRGYSIVSEEQDADIILLNTCSVRDQAEQKAIGKAGHLMAQNHRKNQKRLVGILGCMAQNRGSELLDSLPDLDLIVGTQKFHQVPDHLDNIIKIMQAQGPKPSKIVDLEEEEGSQNTIRGHLEKEHQVSAFVSIMQGCNMNCAFCLVPNTRGKERARPIEDIVEEVEELAANGTKDVTLLGQIVTSYGRREIPFKDGKSPFVQLIERVNDVKGIERIRFTSPHPRGFKQDLVEAYRDVPKLCEYVHLPIQSGSDKILRAMNRPYTRDRYLQIVDALRTVVPDMYFSTDIIVGFPGETEEDFELTRQVLESVGFDMAYIFKYSVRPNTAAEPLGDPISKEIKEERNQTLLRIVENSSLKRNNTLIGTTQEVLVEGPAKKGEDMYVGRTRGYRKTIFKGNSRLIGELVPVCIEEGGVSTLMGKLKIND